MDQELKQLIELAQAKMELERRQKAEVGSNDLYAFDKFILGYDLMQPQPHRELCDIVMNQQRKKKLVMLPRGSFKSSVVTISYPLWRLEKNPNLRILIDNETFSNSKAFLAEAKGMLENPEVLAVYPHLEPNKKINNGWTEDSVILKARSRHRKEPNLSCAGIDNTKVGMHYDIIIMDDVVSTKNVTTPEQMKQVIDHYRLILSLLEPDGELIIIGTRYHIGDLYGHIIENESSIFEILVRPAILPDGQLFFPSRLTREFLSQQRQSQGSYIYECQYMLNPTSEDNVDFKKSWLQYWDGEYKDGKITVNWCSNPDIQTPISLPVNVFTTVDPASSKKKDSDFTTAITNGVTPDNKWFILDMVRDKLNPTERVDLVFSQHKKYKAIKLGYETVGFQESDKHYTKKRMFEENYFFSIEELKTQQKRKEDRIRGMIHRWENHGVFLPKSCMHKTYDNKITNMVTAFEDEYFFFPRPKHDDMLDAMAYQEQIAFPPYGGGSFSPGAVDGGKYHIYEDAENEHLKDTGWFD